MLGCTVRGYTKGCSPIVGGVDELFVGDANDFVLTSGSPNTDGDPTGYDNIELRDGATSEGGALLYPIDSIIDSLGVEITQANADGTNTAYEYTISARLAQMSQALTNFNTKIDSAALCCQLIFVWRNNDGKMFVIGEKYVDGTVITRFRFRQDGSRVGTGKKFTDFNGQDLSLKGSYSRLPYEFVGDAAIIEALKAEETS